MRKILDLTYERCESFEAEKVPSAYQAVDGGFLELSKKHYKHGETSLLWSWSNGSSLTVTKPKFLDEAGESLNGGIKAWIYCEQAINGKLTFNFGKIDDIKQGNPRYTFDFNLNYKGWRTLWVHFREDALNTSYHDDNQINLEIMEVLPPNDVLKGNIFFDLIEFTTFMREHRSSDYQIPMSRTTFNDGKGDTWSRTYYYSTKKPRMPIEKVTREQEEAFDIITDRYTKWVYGENLNLLNDPIHIRYNALQEFIKSGVMKFNTLNIKRDNEGNITGVPHFSSRSTHIPEFGNNISKPILLPLVFDYKINGNEESKQKVLELFDFMNDQGWAEGSALGTLDHETLGHSGYFHGVFLMKDELKETGRLERELATIYWYIDFGKTFEKFGVDYTETTSDEMRSRFLYCLLYILALEDVEKKAQYMRGLVEWINSALMIAPGFADTIKPDYMGFHHRGVYGNAYAPHGYHLASILVYLLHNTPFAISEKAVKNLKNALLTQYIIANKYDVPIGVCGRFPYDSTTNHKIVPAYAYMALASEPVDKDMAGIFMSYWEPELELFKQQVFKKCESGIMYCDTLGALQMMINLADMGYKPVNNPEGFWMKPYAALAIHRRDNWLVSTKGWSQYVWDFESSATNQANLFGRYISYGAIQILSNGNPVNTDDSGYVVDKGWDWNRWPGATTKKLPLEKLAIPEENRKDNWIDRAFTDETFVGGVCSKNKNGIFAMKFHDTVYDKSFRANKTVFYFGNEIICLGSDIINDDTDYSTETTLFQSYIKDSEVPFYMNSEESISAFPYYTEIKSESSVWLIDPYNNGYIIPNAKGLHIQREVQHSIDNFGIKETDGMYTTAWMDHGVKPHDAGYEYVILVQTIPEEVEKYQKNPPYQVLRKDSRAHIVEHRNFHSMGYVIFDQDLEVSYGIVKSTNSPVIIMVKNIDDGVVFSVADPDLRLPKRPNQANMPEDIVWSASEMQKVQIEIRGNWKLKENATDVNILDNNAGTTVLEFNCVDGKTAEVILSLA